LLGEIESKTGSIRFGLEDEEIGVRSALVLKENNAIERIGLIEDDFAWIKKTIKAKAGQQKKKVLVKKKKVLRKKSKPKKKVRRSRPGTKR
jgi:hypothetical protein